MQTPDQILIQQLQALADEFKKKSASVLDNLVNQSIDRVKLAQLIAQLDFFKELQDQGLNLHLAEFFNSYNDQIKLLMDMAGAEGVRSALAINGNILEILKHVDAEMLLGHASNFANNLKRQIVQGLVTGKTNPEIVKNMDEVNLTNTQLNTVVSTAYNDYGRAVVSATYQDKPEQKFLYGEGREIDNPHISEICRNALILQAEKYSEGVTRKEIDNGLYQGIDFIHGRGYNCSHSFFPATEFAITLEKRRMAKAEKDADKVDYLYIKKPDTNGN